MAVHWCIVLLSVIIGVAVTEHPPNNPPFVLDEVNAAAETRILERVAHLLQSLSDKIKMLHDRVDSLILAQNVANKSMEKVSEQLQSFSTSTTQRMINLEQKMINLNHKFGRIPEDTGVYFMRPDPSKNITFAVSRDWTNNHGYGDNWIIFQRRFNGSVDFYRNWTEYKQGFGDLRGEHWLGLEKLHMIVKTQRHELLIVLEDFEGVIAYAHYDDFQIGNETEKYIIKSVGKYTGTAGDSFTYHKDQLFTTNDQDNDKADYNCAQSFVGGWWFKSCYFSHLNGKYVDGNNKLVRGINWNSFRGDTNSLKSTKMMVRPVE
ncbi:microfibril-associated glycoprotein 4-like [Anopheles marshallii]|uniref:microfibril-associated glycoprotein 4-like n=1 Tax=Anopheles marshallii TaxID=1521116 RepID=UPI00237A8F51|nr:microfibril-associated glycoprotein 4-like [Anopheles marshallii]XP_053668080.1 microfibril-associated glycoprotein 4-like [Anopheles marshallii]